jgi:putative transposase
MVAFARKDLIDDFTLIHKTWRGHNREWIFKGHEEKAIYLNYLNGTFLKEVVELHALCLMSNHTHEIYLVKNQVQFSKFLLKHHSNFGRYYNRKQDRTGPVSESRPTTKPIENDIHEIISVLYIHANPIRAGIVQSLDDLKNYEWSTHLLYGYGIYKDWMQSVTLPQWYLDFGDTAIERQQYYLFLFRQYLEMTKEKFIQTLQD